MSTTATCAAGCGQPIDLAELHVSIVRQTEREADGQIHVQDSTVLRHRHVDCPKPTACQARIWPSWANTYVTCGSTIIRGKCATYGHADVEAE